MATIKLGPNVTDIRGSVGEVVYSIWKADKHYIRLKPSIISNPKSADQTAIRSVVAGSSARWFTVLTPLQRAGWEEMAQRLASITSSVDGQGGILNMIPPVGGIMSGVNAYVGFRSAYFTAGHPMAVFPDDAPLGEDQPLNVTSLAVVWLSPSLNLTWLESVPVNPASQIRVWVRSRELVYHRQLATVGASSALSLSLSMAKGSQGVSIPFINALPQQMLVQVDIVSPSGYRSPGSETIEVAIA